MSSALIPLLLSLSSFLGDISFSSLHDPEAKWYSLETEHFVLHYIDQQRPIAQRLAPIAEGVHRQLSEDFEWEPKQKTHLVLDARSPVSGGFASPLPYNLIYLHLAYPEVSSATDVYDDWLRLLITHEYTHTMHIDQIGGVNRILRGIFGRAWVPNGVQPQWVLEGFATYNETRYTTGGRGRSSLVRMHLRADSLEDRFIPIERASYWNDRYPFGNTAYWYGIGFHEFIAERYGPDVWNDFSRINGRWPIFSFFNFKTASLLEKSFHDYWEEWRSEEAQYWKELTEKYPSQSKALREWDDFRLLQAPVYWPEENCLLLHLAENDLAALYRLSLESEDAQPEKWLPSFRGSSLRIYEGYLYYSQLQASSRYRSSFDLFRMDLKTKQSQPLTQNFDIRDFDIRGSQVVALRTKALEQSLIRFPLPSPEEKNSKVRPEDVEHLYEFGPLEQVGQIALSPSGNKLAYSLRANRYQRDLVVQDLKTKKRQTLEVKNRLHYQPHWHSNGESLYFSADYDFPQTEEAVFNVFRWWPDSGRVETPVAPSWSGRFWPQIIKGDLWLGDYSSNGFHLQQLRLSQKAASFKTSARETETPKALIPAIPGDYSERAYRPGKELLPQYLFPLWLVSDSTTLVGGAIGSQDPIGKHVWNAFVYYYAQAKSPGASLSYWNRALGPVDLFWNAYASVSRVGSIYLNKQPTSNADRILPDVFYERSLGSNLQLSHPLWFKGKPTGFNLKGGLFFEHRRPVGSIPADAIQNAQDLEASYPGEQGKVLPEKGNQWGFFSALSWQRAAAFHPRGISPLGGQFAQIGLRYSPSWLGSDLPSLTTSFDSKAYLGRESHGLAFQQSLAIQWLEAPYQSSFRLGGSAGDLELPSMRTRSYPFRGLPLGALRAESVFSGSLEYRVRLLSLLPGFGTAPLWFQNLHAAFFSDVGQAFQHQSSGAALRRASEKFSFSRMSLSGGVELRSNISVAYAPPINFRLGYAQVFLLQGSSYWKKDLHEIYFLVGQSF